MPTIPILYSRCFLDDMTVEEVAKVLQTEIFPVTGVEELIETCYN